MGKDVEERVSTEEQEEEKESARRTLLCGAKARPSVPETPAESLLLSTRPAREEKFSKPATRVGEGEERAEDLLGDREAADREGVGADLAAVRARDDCERGKGVR